MPAGRAAWQSPVGASTAGKRSGLASGLRGGRGVRPSTTLGRLLARLLFVLVLRTLVTHRSSSGSCRLQRTPDLSGHGRRFAAVPGRPTHHLPHVRCHAPQPWIQKGPLMLRHLRRLLAAAIPMAALENASAQTPAACPTGVTLAIASTAAAPTTVTVTPAQNIKTGLGRRRSPRVMRAAGDAGRPASGCRCRRGRPRPCVR